MTRARPMPFIAAMGMAMKREDVVEKRKVKVAQVRQPAAMTWPRGTN